MDQFDGVGYVFLIQDGYMDKRGTVEFQIGYSKDPENREWRLQNEQKRQDATLELAVWATMRRAAETAAQNAAQDQLGMIKLSRQYGNATDWFRMNKRRTLKKIRKVITTAVMEHNAAVMEHRVMIGGAAGRWEGLGYVYVMKDGRMDDAPEFKIGCSKNPENRLRQIQSEKKRRNAKLVLSIKANRKIAAATEAQRAVSDKLNMTRLDQKYGIATNWFGLNTKKRLPRLRDIEDVIEEAVGAHNAQ